MRRAGLLFALSVLAGSCKTPDAPDTFGVNLTITLAAGIRELATQVNIDVSGAETFAKTFDLGAFAGSEAHIHYVPGVTSGTLTFTGTVLGGGGTVVATGTTGPVTLEAGRGVSASLTLNGGGGSDGGVTCSPPCGIGTFCASNGTCQPQKTAGTMCGVQGECIPGLTCLDGVCCNSAVCGPCQNCGSDGMCSIPVVSTTDTTGMVCMGTQICDGASACKKALGQDCITGAVSQMDADSKCASGHCVDGVCCGSATCPTCTNCGGTGACDVQVKAMDDTTGDVCALASSCDPQGTCKPRWQQVATATLSTTSNYGLFVSSLGNKVLFATEAGQDAGTNAAQNFKSYDVVTNAVVDEVKTNNTMCNCGLSSFMMPANGAIYYFGNQSLNPANNGHKWVPGSAWADVTGYNVAPPVDGESAQAVVGNKLFRMGGRSNPLLVTSYDTVANTWQLTGYTNAPVSADSGCAGSFGGLIYLIASGQQTVRTFNPTTNVWASLPATANLPMNTQCYLSHLPVWRNRLVFLDGSLRQFDPVAQTWLPPIGLPVVNGVTGVQWRLAVAGPAGDLFLVGYKTQNTTVYINKWIFN